MSLQVYEGNGGYSDPSLTRAANEPVIGMTILSFRKKLLRAFKTYKL